MITEDYVSFETAKLMHDKGFNLADFHGQWAIDFDNVPNTEEEDPEGKIIVAEWQYPLITIQMAMKWLREVHNLFIGIEYVNVAGLGFVYQSTMGKFDDDYMYCLYRKSYEEACEAAIMYCLEKLI